MITSNVFIYGLKTNKNETIRYVGKSINPQQRLKKHIFESKNKKTHKDCWIYSNIIKGNKILIEILEITNQKEWPERETHWISKLKKQIVNHSSGGKGGRPIKYKISFLKFKKWVNKNLPNIKTMNQWSVFISNNSLPDFITKYPSDTYKNRGWKGWGYLFNTENKNYSHKVFFTYEECKKYIKKYNIKTIEEWYLNNKKFYNKIPKEPEKFYIKQNTWRGWKDFLDSDSIRKNNKNYYSYEKCREYIKNNFNNLNVKIWRNKEFQKKLPIYIPGKPDRVFKKTNTWISWGDFLGTNSIAPQKRLYKNYFDAKQYIKNLKIKNNKEWRQYCTSGNKPIDIPSSPDKVYKEWINWKEWLN